MIKKTLLLIFFLYGTIATCFSQVSKEDGYEIPPLPKQFTGILQVMEIHIISQKEVKKQTKESVKRTRKFYKQTNYPWTKPKLSKAVESYIIELKDSANYWFTVVSQKSENTSIEKVIVGKKYELELIAIYYTGSFIASYPVSTIFHNGNYIPLPKSARPFSIYISPNLEGLYYVK